MFKTFKQDDFGTKTLTKSSAVRGIRQKLLESYPRLESVIDDLLPKKDPCVVVRGRDEFAFFNFLAVADQILFFQNGNDGQWLPTLRVLHQYPSMMPKMQVDVGAIKFILKGANVMSPGLISAGGRFETGIKKGGFVQVTAENCVHACGIGCMQMDSDSLPGSNGVAIESIHYLNDGLFKIDRVN